MKKEEREKLRDDFGDILHSAMVQKGHCPSSIARELGTSREFVRHILLGLGSMEMTKKMCDIIGVSFQSLFKKDGADISIEERYPRFLRVRDVCVIFKMDPTNVYDLVRNGTLKSIKIGKRGIRVLESSVTDFINKQLGD